MNGLELVEAARLAETYGDGTVRIGTDQNITFTGVPEDRVEAMLAEDLLQKYSPYPGPFTRGVVACTGRSSAATPSWRPRSGRSSGPASSTSSWPASRWARTPCPAAVPGPKEDAGVIRMHFSGCSASCAQPQIADIGFRGEVAHVGNHLAEAVDIGMGGSLGAGSGFIDWIEHARPVNDVPDALLRVVRRYQSERREDEPFYNWARRVPNDDLRRTLAEEGTGTPVTLGTKPARRRPTGSATGPVG